MNKTINLAIVLSLFTGAAFADVSRECRGLAAGVVSAMKSDGYIANKDEILVAIKAARRACAAVLEGFSTEDLMSDQDPEESKQDAKEKKSAWDLLTQEGEKKAGNKRLDRLKN